MLLMGKTFSHHLVMQYFEVSHFSNFYCDLYKTSRFDRNNVEIGSLLKRQVRGAKISLEKSVCVTLYPHRIHVAKLCRKWYFGIF